MAQAEKPIISVNATVNAPVDKVWKLWTSPEDIVRWNNASDDWHTPRAENDLRTDGTFNYRMEAKDGSMGFDFVGVYQTISVNRLIDYTIADGRRVTITFTSIGNATEIIETFETESTSSPQLQRNGWQSILNNFKKYAESRH